MPVIQDFSFIRFSDGTLTIGMTPPCSVAGQTLRFSMMRRFGGDVRFDKWTASGYTQGESGISVLDATKGILSVAIWTRDTSGCDFSAYAYQLARLDSGHANIPVEGYVILTP